MPKKKNVSINVYSTSWSGRIITLTALCMVMSLFPQAAAADGDTHSARRAVLDSMHAVLEHARRQNPAGSEKAAASLIDRIYTRGRLPVIVRLKPNEQSYDSPAAGEESRGALISTLQNTVLDDVFAQTGLNETELRAARFSIIPAMALQVDAHELEALLEHPNVVDIIEDVPVPPALMESVPLIGAGLDGSFGGFTGQGQAVAIIDTGVDKNHPFLKGKVVSEACYSSNVPSAGATSLCPSQLNSSTATDSALNCSSYIDGCDHGTHVAGIAAGSNDTFSGVAKDASIIAIQVFSRVDSSDTCSNYSLPTPCALSYTSDQIRGLERVYELRGSYAIAAANMSLGGELYASPWECNSKLYAYKYVIDDLREAGIATVIASGNSYSTNALTSPACIASSVSVGNTTKQDSVSSSSNSAYFLSLLAPGSSILSSEPGKSYRLKSGTSMAAPHVAGAWAVLKQAKPSASVNEVLGALQFNGVPVTDTRIGADNRTTPRIEVQDALDSLLTVGSWIQWDDGVYDRAGPLTDSPLSVASHWRPGETGGGTITKIRVGVHDVPSSAQVQIWQGDDDGTMELRYSQAFTPAARRINEIVLDTPYVINDSQQLFIGWSATHGAGEYPYALDRATNTNQQGNLVLAGGTWQNYTQPGDWIIHAFLEGTCFSDADCTSAEEPVCSEGTCVDCRVDEDCGPGNICKENICVGVKCTIDEDCGPAQICEENICVESCGLDILHSKKIAAMLDKEKKGTLKITGGAEFDPYGTLDLGPLTFRSKKVSVKKARLKVKVFVPAGLEPGTIKIRVGDCVGEIELL